jgi:hypothetical protein
MFKATQLYALFFLIVIAQSYALASQLPAANATCTQDCCKSLTPSRSPLTYTFYQKTGRFVGGSGAYAIDTHAYSGQGKGYLNPDY